MKSVSRVAWMCGLAAISLSACSQEAPQPTVSAAVLSGEWSGGGGSIQMRSDRSYSYSGLNLPGVGYSNCGRDGSGTWGFMVQLGNSSDYQDSPAAKSGNDVMMTSGGCSIELLTTVSSGKIALCLSQGGDDCDSGIYFTRNS
jgi:hypothetical protein